MALIGARIVHLIAVIMIMSALGGILADKEGRWRGMLMGIHGTGMLLAIVAGIGLTHALGMEGWPGWVYVKVLIWVMLGGLPVVARKMPDKAKLAYLGSLGLASLAVILAATKPF